MSQASFQADGLQPLPIYHRRSPNEILRTGRARVAADCKRIRRVVDSHATVFMRPVSGAAHNSIVLVTDSRPPLWFAYCSRVLARHAPSTFGALLLLRTAVCARVRSTSSRLRSCCAQSRLQRVGCSGANVRACLPLLGPLMHCADCRLPIERVARRSAA